MSLIGGCVVSFADLPSSLEGFFGRKRASEDTLARASIVFDLFLGARSPRRLVHLARSLQTSVRSVSRTNKQTFFLTCVLGPHLPSAVFLS